MCTDGTGALVCSVALSGQAPKPHSGAPQARGLTANAPTEQSSALPRCAPPLDSPGHVAGASFLVQRNSVPSTHMRCMMTASRRATATTARFMPRCRAIFMPRPLAAVGHQDQGRLEQRLAHQGVSAFRDAPHPVDLARLMPARRQAESGTDRLRAGEPGGHIDRGAKGQRRSFFRPLNELVNRNFS